MHVGRLHGRLRHDPRRADGGDEDQLLSAGQGGPLRGVGRVAKWGRTIAFTEGELYDPEGRLVAKATGTAVPTPFAAYK